jgi:hypothetical protein
VKHPKQNASPLSEDHELHDAMLQSERSKRPMLQLTVAPAASLRGRATAT